VSGIVKRVAVLAGLAAAGCTDSYPASLPPSDSFYFPVGIAVRQLPPASCAAPATSCSALVVVSTNFDLRYDQTTGGTVLSVNPDTSTDTFDPSSPGHLDTLGFLRIGSFGGELAIAETSCPASWPSCRSGCPELAAAGLGDGVARVVTASRADQTVYLADMDGTGALTCGPTCPAVLSLQSLDPYGVGLACGSQAGVSAASAYVSQLRAINNQGLLTRLDLVGGAFDTVELASPTTYTSAFDPTDGLLFLSTQLGLTQPLRWFRPLLLPAVTSGASNAPAVQQVDLATDLRGTLTRDLQVSNDRTRLYVVLELFDADALANSGVIIARGGAIGVFDLTRNSFNQPSMTLLAAVPTCLGSGQARVLPPRPLAPDGHVPRDLVAVTCDVDGTLVLYDDEAGKVVDFVGLDPVTGVPLLGRQPFGLAVEPLDPSRATVSTLPDAAALGYGPSPCGAGSSCVRLYVASFEQSWVNILEMDAAQPGSLTLVKRIGMESAP